MPFERGAEGGQVQVRSHGGAARTLDPAGRAPAQRHLAVATRSAPSGWWDAYRHDPAAHAGGVSLRVLAALAVLACLGLVALLVAG